MYKFPILIGFILTCLLVGFLGSYFTISSIPTWYAVLNKPFFSPPNWLFGPVWTTLYILMGISAFLIWKKKKSLKLFWIQLGLNFLWTPVFFGAKNIIGALIVIVFLWYLILRTIQDFAKIDKVASYLLYPYIAWVSFAALLNFSLLILNF